MRLAVDHLVVAARTLSEGLDWCDTTLGVRPESGGQHVFMGTHNRVFNVASPAFPRAYFEIIAIDPELPAPGRARWFDLDDAALQRTLAQGPQLVHWVARCDDITAACAAMRSGDVDCGTPLRAERATPGGVLRWQISVRADGRRPLAGAAPALIEWGSAHPADALAPSGVTLESMRVSGWPAALTSMLPDAVDHDASGLSVPLGVVLAGPRGRVILRTTRLEPRL